MTKHSTAQCGIKMTMYWTLIVPGKKKKVEGRFKLSFESLFEEYVFPGGSDDKESSCNAGDLGLVPGLRRCPGGGHGNPLWRIPNDRGAWQAAVHGVTKSQIQLSD